MGVYGVISYAVSLRAREIGLRMALGARAVDVKGMVLRPGSHPLRRRRGVGLVLALGLTRLMSGLLFGVEPTDPVTYVIVAVGLFAWLHFSSYAYSRHQ